MQNLEDLKQKIYFESKNILETLSTTSNSEELLMKRDLIEELNERVSFLKHLERNEDYFSAPKAENLVHFTENESAENQSLTTDTLHEDFEEEVKFTNELNEMHLDEEIENEDLIQPNELSKGEDYLENNEIISANIEEEENIETVENEVKDEGFKNSEFEISNNENFEVQENKSPEIILDLNEGVENSGVEFIVHEEGKEDVIIKNELFDDEFDGRGEILDFEMPKKATESLPTIENFSSPETEHAKKIRLSNIKGLKSIQSIFDEDPLENLVEKQETVIEKPAPSLLKSNISTDFMEAEKGRPDFKLDLNDHIAFSKILFNGSQSELNESIRKLNSFKTLDEAKEFLSDLYYDKNWKKHDDYAQRLWSLVENKFL